MFECFLNVFVIFFSILEKLFNKKIIICFLNAL